MPVDEHERSLAPPSQGLPALAVAWLVPAFTVINIACSVRFNPIGWLIVEITPLGNALIGAVLLGVVWNQALLASGMRPWVKWLALAGLAASAILSILAPLRLVFIIAAAVLVLKPHMVEMRGRKGLTVGAVILLGLAVLATAVPWRASSSNDAVVHGPGRGFDFVFHDGDAGATGGATTGEARLKVVGIAEVHVRVFYGELGARPAVHWVDDSRLSIDGTEVHIWSGPYIEPSREP
ncbi:MAG: hypothetical protein ACYDHQ_06610 [Coriobacteriia bacterium]